MTPNGSARGLALYGGAFNPPHTTHRRIVEAALQQLPVDEVRVLPAGDHPHKRRGDVAPAEHRLEMCRLAFGDLPHVVVDDRELRRTGLSFTVDTLEEFRREDPSRELWFVIGSDNLPLLPTWRAHHRILQLAKVATFPRLHEPIDAARLEGLDLSGDERRALLAHVLHLAPDAIAAQDLRRRLAAGERDLAELDPRVESYARDHHLYGT